ncbi:hypothetical protein [Arthrobacter phoenicis]
MGQDEDVRDGVAPRKIAEGAGVAGAQEADGGTGLGTVLTKR